MSGGIGYLDREKAKPHGVRVIYGSICSGVGSCRLASAGLDWTCAFFAEIEPFPSAVLAHHFPEVPNYGDFTQIGESAGPIDILVGGTPCQSFSVAGKRAGLDSPNGNLAIEFARLAQRLRARWIVWENVPGVLSSWSDAGEGVESSDFDSFLAALEDVGYSTSWTVLDAQYFGVPQRRRRVFVVGYRGDWRPPAAVLFEPDSLRGDSAPSYEAREEPAGTLGSGSGGWSPDTDRMTFVPVTANSINARDGKGSDPGRSVGNVVAHALTGEGADASEDGTGRGTPLVLGAYQCQGTNVGEMGTLRAGNGNETGGVPFVASDYATYQYEQSEQARALSTSADRSRSAPIVAFSCKDAGEDAGEVSPTLRSLDFDKSHANGGGQVAVAIADRTGGAPDAVASALTEQASNGDSAPCVAYDMRGRDEGAQLEGPHDTANIRSSAGGSSRSYLAEMSVRRLTPRECERLQGYPDDWTLVPYNGKPAKDAPRYRAIGNGWAVPVVAWIFRRIDAVERVLNSANL